MAAVTQCDVCNNVVKNEQAMYIKVFNCNEDGSPIHCKISKDLCPDCYAKLRKLLKEEAK